MKRIRLYQQDLLQKYKYDEETGILYHQNSGKEAGTIISSGYLQTKINKKCILVHRIIYTMLYGEIPDHLTIDHVNGNKVDNRKLNLRLATYFQNNMNRPKIKGTSQYKGVSWCNTFKKWRAAIQINGRKTTIGYFRKEENAKRAYKEKAVELQKEYYCERESLMLQHNIDVSSPSGGESCTLKTDKAVP